jgi:AhpD family alkylhydroperoxidase
MTSSSTHYPELAREISSSLAALRADRPAVMQGFGSLSRAAMEAGAIDAKTKELIALALGVAAHCDGCIAFHAKALVGLGVTRAELEETLAVAVYMGGGPSLMYSANALRAFAQFTARAQEPVSA